MRLIIIGPMASGKSVVGDKRNPPVYMVPGDLVEVDIGLLGVLKNPIVAAPKL